MAKKNTVRNNKIEPKSPLVIKVFTTRGDVVVICDEVNEDYDNLQCIKEGQVVAAFKEWIYFIDTKQELQIPNEPQVQGCCGSTFDARLEPIKKTTHPDNLPKDWGKVK